MELVLLVPVLVLLTLFVLWAGRGGRAGLTADLAAEEAATAAALCCDEGAAGEPDRDALAADVLRARPGLEFLCVGGLRPDAAPDRSGGPEFVSEHWLEFDPNPAVRTGGLGVLGVRFLCESDGAVAPLRGLFPTVTFHGQASEVVVRQPLPPYVGFEDLTVRVDETATEIVFVVKSRDPVIQEVWVDYSLSADPGLTHTLGSLSGTVTMNRGDDEVAITVPLDENENPGLFEGTERLVLELTGLRDPLSTPTPGDPLPVAVAEIDADRDEATGEVTDDDARPYLFLSPAAAPCQVTEGGTATFNVRLRNQDNDADARSATRVTVDVRTDGRTGDGIATAGTDYTAVAATTVAFNPGDVLGTPAVVVTILDDAAMPEGEDTETFHLVLENAAGAPLGSTDPVTCEILDDEVEVSVGPASADEDDGTLTFTVALDGVPTADVDIGYRLVDHGRAVHDAQGGGPSDSCASPGYPVDYLPLDAIGPPRPPPDAALVISPSTPNQRADLAVTICDDTVAEPDETFWLEIEVQGGEAIVETDRGAVGTITDDDTLAISVDDVSAVEGTTLEFEVGLEVGGNPATLVAPVTLDYAIVASGTCTGGSGSTRSECEGNSGTWTPPATAGADYDAPGTCSGGSGSTRSECEGNSGTWTVTTPLTGTLSFGAGLTTDLTLSVDLLADYLVEDDETFLLKLSDEDGSTHGLAIADAEAIGTITDVDPPSVSVVGFTGAEGSTRSFTVSLADRRSGETVTVAYVIEASGTCTGSGSTRSECEGNSGTWTPPATAGADYDAPGTCSGGSGSTRSECEGNSGTWTVTTPLSSTVEFRPGEATTQTVPVRLLPDTVLEGDETFRIVLSDPVKAVLDSAASAAVATITNVNPTKLTVDDPTKKEGETLVFTVTLEAPRPGQSVDVDYELQNRSAKAGRDFTAIDPLTGTLTLSNTTSTATVSVKALNDTVAENDETLHLVLSNVQPSSGSVGLEKSIGVGTIENVNPASVRVSNAVAVVEGGTLEFVISLTDDARNPAVITEDVTISYESEDVDPDITGLASCTVAGADYVSQARTSVTFDAADADDREHTVRVQTCTDTLDEDDETMRLTLELAEGTANAGLADRYGTGTIVDAPPPALRVADAAADEGGTITFTVSLDAASNRTVTVQVATEDGTAVAPGDYTAASGRLTFAPGDTSKPFPVGTVLDDIVEVPETIRVVLSGPVNALIDRAVAIGTINPRCVQINDTDQPPTLTVPDGTVPEGGFHEIRIFFSQPLCGDFHITSHFITGGSWGTATCGVDFAVASACLSRDGGQRGGQLTLLHSPADSRHYVPGRQVGAPGNSENFAQDGLDEDDEWLTMRARWDGMPGQYPLDWVTARLTIIDDDGEPSLSIADAAADEGDAITFTVTLDAASGKTVTVAYSTIDGSGTAESADYTAASGTLVFADGDTSKTFTVDTATDTDTEDETFLVELSAPASSDPANPAPPMNARIIDGIAVGSILEGGLPELRIGDARGDEGFDMAFTVTLDQAAAQPLSVDYATVERPAGVWAAIEGTDYTAVSGTLNFAVGDETKTISVPIASDTDDEIDETFLVELSNPSGASLADPSGLGTINGNVDCVDATDPDAVAPVLTIDAPTADEDAAAMVFTVAFSVPYCEEINVWHDRPRGTATLGVDYQPLPARGYLRIDPLRVSFALPVTLIDDDIAEPSETIIVPVRVDARHGRAAPTSGVGMIIDNDTASLSVEASSVDEGEVVDFTVRLDRTASFDVTVDYATADGTATAGADYVAASGTASIPAGELSATVSVATVQDSIGEDTETFGLQVSNPTDGVQLPDEEATTVVSIRDDDIPGVRISDAVANEGGTMTFSVTLDTARAADTVVGFSTRDGTATAGADYALASSSSSPVTIPSGERSATISVAARTDSVLEAEERFFVDLESHSSYRLDDGVGVGTIRDINDRTLTVSDAYAVEGGTLNFDVGFNDPPGGRDITVQYRTVAGTATAGDDYSASFESAAGTLRILAGDMSATARVPTVQDALDEDAEQLELVLSDPVGATLAVDRARGVIIDDDPEPAVSVSNAEATENGDGTPITFTLSLSETSGRDVSVNYSTADLTATAGSDYVAVSNAAETISAGDTSATVDVDLVDDDDEEEIERFQLVLSDPPNASLGDGIGVGTILDDDGLVQILADDAAEVYEGDGAAVFTVRLSEAAADEVTVDYSAADGAAKAGTDYTATSGTLTFAAGETSETVSVALVDDDISEDTETFRLVLSGPSSNARLGEDTATGTILDDDDLAALSVGDASAAEGATASFTVSLSAPQSREVTVAYAAVTDPTAGASAATPAQDYDPVSGTLTIAARSTSATVTVDLPDDSLDEHNETFWLRLSNPAGATVADGTAIGMIADNDPLPQLSIGDGGATEGGTASFTVLLEPVSGRTVTVPWTTAATSSGNPASSTDDYTPASGTLTFPSGTTSARIDVATLQDETSETDETFQVSLGEPTNATLADAIAVGTIRDDDGLPRISIADTEVSEDDSPAIFTVTLSRTSNEAVTVDYATSDGTATAGDDYATSTGAQGTLTIPAGLRRGEISVFVADDDEPEEAETFHITLSNPGNAVIAEDEGTATATIRDDDSVTVSIANAEASEGDGTIDFTVTLSQAHSQTVTVDYTTFDGSAVQTLDYAAASGTLTVAAGNSTAVVSVTLTDDTYAEDDESFQVRLSNPRGDAFLETAEAVGTITDDDQPPQLTISDNRVVEEDVGSMTLEVTMDRVFDREVSVDYYSFWSWGGMRSSQTSCPWVHASGTLVFEPGATTATIPVAVFSDPGTCRIRGSVSGSARFGVQLLNPVNAVLVDWQTGITVLDSIRVPGAPQTVRLNMHRTWGATEGVGNAQVPLRLSAPHSQAVQVGYTIRALTATAGEDYVHSGGSLTIPANQQEATLQIAIVDDAEVEQTESFMIDVTSVTNAKWVSGGTGTAFSIHDNDTGDNDTGIFVSGPTAVGEGSGTVRFSVYFPASITETVTVDYSTVDGTATSPGDYTAVSGTLTYTPPESPSPFFWGEFQSVEVPLIDDDTVETNETFSLVLSNAVGASISEPEAEVTIISDDGRALPLISLADASFYEGDEIALMTYTLSEESAETVTVEFRLLEAPELGVYAAEDSSDYRNGRWDTYTVRIEAGRTSGTVYLNPIDDAIDEHDERFKVELYDPVNAELGTAEAWATILDDDDPIVSIADQTVSEGEAAVVFELALDKQGIVASSVDYTTAPISSRDSAAIPDQDYTHTSGTARFAASSTTATITVPIVGDDTDEPDEMFQLLLSNNQRLRLDDAVGVGTIVDDDPGWTIDDPSVWENNSAGVMDFTVVRDHTSTAAVTVNYRIAAAGSAVGGTSCTDGVDYITPSGSVTLQAADTTATISITLCNDNDIEGQETLLIELTGVPGRKLTGTGTIISDDS